MMVYISRINYRKKINEIENVIWHDCITIGNYYGTATLRDRFHLLFTLGAVIQSESVFKTDLSDLIDFTFHQEHELDPYHVLAMIIEFGKTVKGDNPIYARGLRNKHARCVLYWSFECVVNGSFSYLQQNGMS